TNLTQMEVRRDEACSPCPSRLHLYTHLTLLSRSVFVRCWTHPAASRGTEAAGLWVRRRALRVRVRASLIRLV
ncbi:uncharacterized protein PHACADRAFT_266324, partial [Phanerochaete carnosa HHB-10118-sp]